MINLSVNIGKLKLKNPVMTASGTFGYAKEFAELVNLKRLGAVITKTITLKPRPGNPPPRTTEVTAGMLNSIGLENDGIDLFLKNKLPYLVKIQTPVIVSIGADSQDEFVELARILDKTDIDGVELNISCPNIRGLPRIKKQITTDYLRKSANHIRENPRLISQDPKETYKLVSAVRKATKKTLITKLSPNVTDITEIAKAAEDADTDAISLINTLVGMAVDINNKKPVLGGITGGLSGPCIKPVALRMVWEVAKAVSVPVIGIGGIMNATDALEFIVCGATAVQVGTANFINPSCTLEIIEGIETYMKQNKISDIRELIGSIKT